MHYYLTINHYNKSSTECFQLSLLPTYPPSSVLLRKLRTAEHLLPPSPRRSPPLPPSSTSSSLVKFTLYLDVAQHKTTTFLRRWCQFLSIAASKSAIRHAAIWKWGVCVQSVVRQFRNSTDGRRAYRSSLSVIQLHSPVFQRIEEKPTTSAATICLPLFWTSGRST